MFKYSKANNNHKMKLLYIYILFLATLFSTEAFSQDQSFETNVVPSNWTAKSGTLSISDVHYKHSKKSLSWKWTANDYITVTDLQANGLDKNQVLGFNYNMFRMWVYNSQKIEDQFLEIKFYDNNNIMQYHYKFNLNFKAWRSAAISYLNEMLGRKSSTNLVKMVIQAPSTGSGTLFIDYIDYTMERNTYRSADYQLSSLKQDNGHHWTDMMYFNSLPKTVKLLPASSSEKSELNSIKEKYNEIILGSAPSYSKVSNAKNEYNALNISYSGEQIYGDPLYGTDYKNYENINAVDSYILTFAQNYKHNNSSSSKQYFINSIRYLLDQGYADGSLLESCHHVGYKFRNVAKSIHLMKSQLIAEGLWTEAQKMVEWYTAVDIIWHPTAYDSNMDEGNTRTLSILGACLYKDDINEAVQYLKGYKLYLEKWITTYGKQGVGLKPDYGGFHHDVYYPGYAFHAYNSISEAIKILSESDNYSINTESRELLKKVLLAARVVSTSNSIPNSTSGRTPFPHSSIAKGLSNLGLVEPVDVQLLEAHNYLYTPTSETYSYGKETPPNGFWQINYANLGAYRKADWVADMKGFTKYFWGSEIYSSDNRYGRYQSYGALEIMYKGGYPNSGFNINGWNWNMPPGTTTIHLSWDKLKAKYTRQDEETDSNFASSLRFGSKTSYYIDSIIEGEYGMFAMDFTQKNNSPTHDTSFKFKKSVFCLDGKLICIGTNISNSNYVDKTATNLFQNYLKSTSTKININGNKVSAFPYSKNIDTRNSNWIIDAVGTGYYVSGGNKISINKSAQSSPKENGEENAFTNGNFASAYIDHGKAPNNDKYEYVVIPSCTESDMLEFSDKMNSNEPFYTLIQANSRAHIIKYNDIYAYSIFKSGDLKVDTLLLSSNKPCLAMLKSESKKLKLTVTNPNLYFGSNGISQPTTVTLKFKGLLKLVSSTSKVNLEIINNNTYMEIETRDGLAVDIVCDIIDDLANDDLSRIKNGYSVFPNPSIGEIYFKTENPNDRIEEVKIINYLGITLYSKKGNLKKMDLSNLKRGIYIVIILSKNGTSYHRVIIDR